MTRPFASLLLLIASTLTLCPASAFAKCSSEPFCGSRPDDWCCAPPGDPCGRHEDTGSCREDPHCIGIKYSGESVIACIFDQRGFATNCPTVGCITIPDDPNLHIVVPTAPPVKKK